MALSNNSSLGPYQIIALLGTGGMGEVYRARDTRLGREVALKIMHAEMAEDRERRVRFAHEAKAVAALNHPNIVAVYDVGNEGGIFYMVSELVDGEVLRDRMDRGPFTPRELLDLAAQIADGIAAAHAAGITHRDLKPENIMRTRDGRVKILDFGLAKQAQQAVQQEQTRTVYKTEPGMAFGTPSYMSPEQATAGTVDYRSDQFSFGVILYEMASGRRGFTRATTVQTLNAILTESPAPLDASLPGPFRWTIDRCLAKEPQRRYESTRDLWADLCNQRDHFSDILPVEAAAPASKPPAPPRRKIMLASTLTAAALSVAALAGWAILANKPRLDMAQYRFTPVAVSLPHQTDPLWSPDGKAFAYTGSVKGVGQVFVRFLNSHVPRQLTHALEDARVIGWSPDASRVYFLSVIDRNGDAADGLYSVPSVGGQAEQLLVLRGFSNINQMATAFSPDGKLFAALQMSKDGKFNVFISSPVGSEMRPYSPPFLSTKALNGVPQLAFSPNRENLLLMIAGTDGAQESWLIPFPTGTPKRVLAKSVSDYLATFSWMPDSKHIVLASAERDDDRRHLRLADTRSDEVSGLTTGTGNERFPSVSPDGKKIIYAQIDGELNVVSVSLSGAAVSKPLDTSGHETMPAYAASRPEFAYVTDRNAADEIWIHSPDGSDRPVVIPADFSAGTTLYLTSPALSPDGDRVIYGRAGRDGSLALWISSVAGGSPVKLTSDKDAFEYGGSWSPDGSHFAFVRLAAGTRSLVTVKTGGGGALAILKSNVIVTFLPQWSPTGEWIAFRDRSGIGLISPDGLNTKAIGKIATPHVAFSRNGKLLFGVRKEGDHEFLISMDLASGQEKIIGDLGKDLEPRSKHIPGIRFTLSPNGENILYSINTQRSALWMLEGFGAR